MRLIDADELINKAETCIETTDAFIELIKNAPTVETKEITFDDVKRYCVPRCLSIITYEELFRLTHPKEN